MLPTRYVIMDEGVDPELLIYCTFELGGDKHEKVGNKRHRNPMIARIQPQLKKAQSLS